jgi:hypothetical protein
MARNFKELESRMSPESLARAKVLANEMIGEILRARTGQSDPEEVTNENQEERPDQPKSEPFH